MQFRIAATFTDSLAKLSADEQKAAKTRAFDLQVDPSASGLSFHRIDRTKDRNFWSVRVNRDIRLIVHRTPSSIMLVHVDHHDAAYRLGAAADCGEGIPRPGPSLGVGRYLKDDRRASPRRLPCPGASRRPDPPRHLL